MLLGLVQGLTEFIPISSTAHLRILPALLALPDPGSAFSAVIQLGSLLAVFAYFFRDILNLATAALISLWRHNLDAHPQARMAWAIALGNLPIVLLGLSFRDWIEGPLRSLYIVGTMLILVALALAWSERKATQQQGMECLDWRKILLIGCFQALALIPGSSRSGSTILGGLALGMRLEEAARFSFLLGIPAILGSGLLQLKPLLDTQTVNVAGPVLLAGLAAAALSGFWSIGFLLNFLKSRGILAFVVYRILLGTLILVLAGFGVIS